MFEKEAEKKTAAFFYIFFVFCIDIKQKRVYIIIIRQERKPAKKKQPSYRGDTVARNL